MKHRRRDWDTKPGESWIDHLVGRLSYPRPAKTSFVIEVPGCAATVHDLRSPLIIGRRNCECKCDNSRENHPAKNSHKERAPHFHLLSITLQSKLAFAPVLSFRGRIHFQTHFTNRTWLRRVRHIDYFKGADRDDIQRLIKMCSEVGLFIVSKDELESWMDLGVLKGKAWNRKALEELHDGKYSKDLRKFVEGIVKFLTPNTNVPALN